MKKQPPKFPEGKVDQFIQRRVCSRCYGELNKRFAENRLYEVFCPTCGPAWGYTTISRKHAEMRGQIALAEHLEVKYEPGLADIFRRPQRSTDEIISELY